MLDRVSHHGTLSGSEAYGAKPIGLVWIDCSYPVTAAGLARALEERVRVHLGSEAPTDIPACAIVDTDRMQPFSESVKRIQALDPDIAILAFSLHLDLALAQAALQAGARGFIHAGMQPHQILRAVEVATKGELAAPRELLAYVLASEEPVSLDVLNPRQREILGLLAEGLTNAQIAQHLYLSESTIKQHLRHAYKLLGVKNRTEAAKFFRKEEVPWTQR